MITPNGDSTMTDDRGKPTNGRLVEMNGEQVLEVDSGMSVGDHLHDLRRTVILALIFPVIIVLVAWAYWPEINHVMLDMILSKEAQADLSVNESMSAFTVSLKMAFNVAITVSLPWVLLQIWFFISPGLYPHERRFVRTAIPLAIGLFYAGIAFGLTTVLPTTMQFLMDYGRDEFAKVNFSVSEFYNLCFALLLVLGVCFQLPIIVAPLVRFGILQREFVGKYRRVIYFIISILAAIITPTGDPLTMMLVAVPLALLMELGLWLGLFWKKLADRREAMGPQTIAEGWQQGLSGGRRDISEEGLLGEKAAEGFADSVGKMARDFASSFKESGEAIEEALSEPSKQESDEVADDEANDELNALPADQIPRAPIAPKAPLPGVSRAETNVPGVEPGSQVPEYLLDPNRPVPKLPRELRRRIDAYIQARLEELLAEVLAERDKQDEDKPDEPKES
ncbi:MAG: twin-arginine translocase subunit TatC [Planctomycetes bacterium]|nr:twin-arginine translocase subunit TatC [Planctomycetota bacterium]